MATIIDGKSYAAGLRATVADAVRDLGSDHGCTPGLAVILCGDDPASAIYVRNKGRQADAAGILSREIRLPADVDQARLLDEVDALNRDPAIDGILVQLPLPSHLDASAVLETIDWRKDVDGFHAVNVGRLASGQKAMSPCTPLGCVMLLRATLGDLRGRHAVILGRSNIVGKPLAQLLLAEDCTVTVAHSRTRDLPALCRTADILVAAVGIAGLVKGDWIKAGATVIDVGINRIASPDGASRIMGDVAFDEAEGHAGAITPVPGGVGPMTIACLLANTVAAACAIRGIAMPPALAEAMPAHGHR